MSIELTAPVVVTLEVSHNTLFLKSITLFQNHFLGEMNIAYSCIEFIFVEYRTICLR